MKPYVKYDLIILVICVLAGTLVNTLPSPIESSGADIFGLAGAVIVALLFRPVVALPASFIICAPIWLLDVGIASKVTLTLLPVVVSLAGMGRPAAKVFKRITIGWAIPALVILLAEHYYLLLIRDTSLPLTGQVITWLSGVLGFISGQFIYLWVSRRRRHRQSEKVGIHFLLSYLFAGSFFIAVLSIVYTTIGIYQKQERQQFQSYMEQRVEVLAEQLDEFVLYHQQAIAQSGVMLSSMARDDDYSALATRTLSGLQQHYPQFLTFLITDASGDIRFASPQGLMALARESGYVNVSGREYFSAVMKSGQPYSSDVFQGRGFGDDPIIALSAPIKDNAGNTVGIIEGSLSLKSFQRFDAQNISGFSMILTDTSNRVIYGSPALRLSPLSTAPALVCGADCVSTVTILDKRWLYVTKGIAELGWKLRLLFDHNQFMMLSNEYLVNALIVLVILSALGTVTGLVVAGMVDSPVRALARRVVTFNPRVKTLDTAEPGHAWYIREIASLDDEFVRLQQRLITVFDELGEARNVQRNLNHELTGLNRTLEQRIVEKTRSLATALDEANAASVAKTQFLANMSHEIRTPMNGIIGNCELLREQQLSAESDARVAVIAHSAMNLLAILDNVLDWSKIEAGKVAIDTHPTSVPQLLDAACELYRQRAAQKGVSIVLDSDASVPDCVLIDSGKVSQVINNLLSNAVKFTSLGEIRVTATFADNVLKVSVADPGVGIPKEKQAAIFEQFEQADASTTRLFGGTGLGLAISRGLIEAMQGTIALTSAPDQGTCFSLHIPCEVAKQQKVATVVPELPAKLRVLLVEDNDINAQIVQDMLKQEQVMCLRTANGKQALEAVDRHTFDVVLMDCQMPVMDGLEATRRIRQRDDIKSEIPIVALTANAFSEDRRACLAAGMTDFLTKPVTRQRLFSVLASVCAVHRQA